MGVEMTTEGGWFSLTYRQDLTQGAETDLDQMGREGWELVSVIPLELPGLTTGTRNAIAFFKRLVSEA
jgi:hypothetical protein